MKLSRFSFVLLFFCFIYGISAFCHALYCKKKYLDNVVKKKKKKSIYHGTYANELNYTVKYGALVCFFLWYKCHIPTPDAVSLYTYMGSSQGGPDMLSSLRNNHMTILHILAVHDLHCIPRYISTYT